METAVRQPSLQFCTYRLNRTMQYGNSSILQNPVAIGASLNRTMQYGNDYIKDPFKPDDKVFKSYYVVWKPVNTGTTVNRQFEFKSYYVVWKHDMGMIMQHAKHRLNRTMQYGNKPKAKEFFKGMYGLNRTMQYGNCTF